MCSVVLCDIGSCGGWSRRPEVKRDFEERVESSRGRDRGTQVERSIDSGGRASAVSREG